MFNKIKNEISTEVVAMNIGNNIAALRKQKGITQEELANELGVSAQAVSKWENNSSCPDVSLLTDIADYFGVTVDTLLRSNEQDIVMEVDDNSNHAYETSNNKTDININIVQQNGKENNIKVPFKFVKLGLNIGSMFGLSEEVSNKIVALVESDVTDIVDINTENGEHITITLL
ncbi:MAG: helix-turn-helix domain-containing protein [Eubacterium sp.]